MTTVSQALRQALRARPSGNLSGKISENLESKLLSVLKNSSMPLYAFRSMIQNPAFVVFEPWFPSVLILFWALDRSDTDFFNRLFCLANSPMDRGDCGRICFPDWSDLTSTQRRTHRVFLKFMVNVA